MTIQEAIRSGKRYRRGIDGMWTDANKVRLLTLGDILADDWEIEREPREVFLICDQQDNRFRAITFLTLEDAKMYYPENHFQAVKFREVIE